MVIHLKRSDRCLAFIFNLAKYPRSGKKLSSVRKKPISHIAEEGFSWYPLLFQAKLHLIIGRLPCEIAPKWCLKATDLKCCGFCSSEEQEQETFVGLPLSCVYTEYWQEMDADELEIVSTSFCRLRFFAPTSSGLRRSFARGWFWGRKDWEYKCTIEVIL